MKLLAPLALSLTVSVAYSAISGAWETFPTEEKANAWLVYDYANETFTSPDWINGEDPFIRTTFAENPSNSGTYNQGLWLFADNVIADGAFTGDFHNKGIRGIEVDIRFENPSQLSFCDIVIGSNATGELIHYYTDIFEGSSFADDGWYFLNPLFSDSWFIYDKSTDEYVETSLTPAILANITEIGIRVFPSETNDSSWSPEIDNIALTPTVATPNLHTRSSDTKFELSFDQDEGNSYTIQKYNFASNTWEDLAGQNDLRGTHKYIFERTLIPEGEFFRVLSAAAYSQVTVPN
ncbi:MAG: hypothetical protein ACON5H_01180 [Akkermansiaceae bacterium]